MDLIDFIVTKISFVRLANPNGKASIRQRKIYIQLLSYVVTLILKRIFERSIYIIAVKNIPDDNVYMCSVNLRVEYVLKIPI